MSQTRTKELALRIKVAVAKGVDETQMTAIRPFLLREFAPEDLLVREYLLAHNGIDRDGECFAPPLLDDFARTLVGKGAFVIHPTSYQGDGGPAEGKVYAARTERVTQDEARKQLGEPTLQFPPDATDAVLLRTWAYYVRTPENQGFLLKLDAGIADKVSIGFNATARQRLTDADGRELNAYQFLGPGEGLEMSHVWLGAQPGARATKSAKTDPEPRMTIEQELKDARTEIGTLKASVATHTATVSAMDAVRKALGDNAKLVETPAALATVVANGIAAHKGAVGSVIALERHLKITGDKPDDIKAAEDLYAGWTLEKVQALQKTLESRLPTGSKLDGGDPNAAVAPPAEGTKAPAFDSPMFG